MSMKDEVPVYKDAPKRAAFEVSDVPEQQSPEADKADEAELRTLPLTLPRPTTRRVVGVANQKGGVGKTTTAVNLAVGLAMSGLRVLLIDVDPQGNASTALGIPHEIGTPGTYEVLVDQEKISPLAQMSPETPGLEVVPATIDLSGAELQLAMAQNRERRLKDAIDEHLKDHDIDYVILDCPPSLGLLTINALVAADEVLLPIQCEYYALEGVTQLQRTITAVQKAFNPQLTLTSILMTMFDKRTRLSADVVEEVRQHFPGEVMTTLVPRSVRVAEAPSYQRSVLTYEPRSTGAVAYRAAAAEFAKRHSKTTVSAGQTGTAGKSTSKGQRKKRA
ncbi:ParA family protein [Acidipropionibacterium jensenii]|uniref:ParA family protein n=1 Tax=Acidipropionibacterium jensenii TaxID=1749 RepID=A0A3Q9UM41_9ACTN|nr:AAA family ATPase [Acidipropionibacterium jensenii]AZZ40578.1 ParA family protein [Acidipropionibacterium jensenii]MDN5977535.1 AAA family ATPase [Acidipropionibacterium jensenii]MDN5996495.1 AAA family ATPase [Acidipropionibacterium jensenii]MDN6020809.1 AAA family ATPase [Acidipropionibacterium jensenii]MDN6425966.1 AAA family ATPase [Acidipropionibacterium jensenii]